MKFFDRDWLTGELTDTEYEARFEKYYAHFDLIRVALPQSLVDLSESGVLHDALVEVVQVDSGHGRLVVELLGGYLQAGYRALHLRYDGMELDDASRITLEQATLDPATEFLYGELDLRSDGRFEHRMLLWPYREVSVCFRAFDIVSIDRPTRQRRPGTPKYIEIR